MSKTKSRIKRVINLVLKKKWFDMIESGEKKEEYREVTPYWMKRLAYDKIDSVKFHLGYTNKCITYVVQYATIGRGKEEWGAEPGKYYFIIRLGERLPF